MAHYALTENQPDEKRAELDRLLTGPVSSHTSTVDTESGLLPPAWWDGDEEAAQSSMLAPA